MNISFVLSIFAVILIKCYICQSQSTDEQLIESNRRMDEIINMVKIYYGSQFEPLILNENGPYKLAKFGTVKIKSGSIHGLSSAKRFGNAFMMASDLNRGIITILSKILFTNVNAKINLDAKIYDSVSLKDNGIEVKISKALIDLDLSADLIRKQITINNIKLVELEGFQAKAVKAAFPVKTIINSQLKRQSKQLKNIAKEQISDLSGYQFSDIKSFDSILEKII